MIIVPGSASSKLASSLAKVTGASLAEVESRRFPDKEFYARIITDLTGEHVVLVQTTHPDHNIMECLILMDAIKDFKIKKLTLVVPYFGYARQDKKFKDGEAISARMLAKHFSIDADAFLTVDLHAPSIMQWFDIPVHNVNSMPALAKRLKEEAVDMILSPDKGAMDRSRSAAEIIGCPWDYMEKTRLDGDTVAMKAKSLDVSGKVVAITDDIIATGGTMITAARQLKEQGASKVIAACTHGLYTKNALPRLQEAFDLVISTDTLESYTSVVTVAEEIAKLL